MQHSGMSEGVASAVDPQPVVEEFVPSGPGGETGETSGLHGGGVNAGSYGFGETAAAGGGGGTTSAQFGGGPTAASHHASRAGPEAGGTQQAQHGVHSKRKMSEMGEVGSPEPAVAGGAGADRQQGGVQQQQQLGQQQQHQLEGDSAGSAGGEVSPVPSDVAMLVGDASDAALAAGGFLADSHPMLPDDCDSSMAQAIQASLDDARALRQQQEQPQQQRQQQAAVSACGSDDVPLAAAEGAAAAAAAPVDPARPTDADIIAWENRIREAEVRVVPLMGDREPMDSLAAEYADGSTIYRQKIDKLKEVYGSIRRTRGDGNCFFRSFFFGYLEHLLLSCDHVERDRVLARLEAMKKDIISVGGYDELVLETPMDMVVEMVRGVAAPLSPLTIEGLENNMRDEDISSYAVWLLRMVTTSEIKRRAEFFAPFIMGLSDMDVATFCSKCVDPMGEESDHVQLVALTDALQVAVRVVYLDRSLEAGGGGGDGADGSGSAGVHVDMHDFVPEGCPPPALPRVHLLYRPGHYDLLYPTR